MTFSSYPEYKSSGHEWVGEIPSHWLIYRSKNIFSERNVKALESDEQLTASQKYGVIPQKLFSALEDQKVMQVILGRDILKKAEINDFVISMRSFQGGLEFCSYSGAVSSAYVPLFANREIDNRFFKHLFKSIPFISALQNTSNLVRDGQALRYNNFVQLSLPFPSLNEQRTIGAFLDHETARIDALIEEQQRLIELLKEKRQAVISHAVTKGLDPTVSMKESGVEWLGEVPAHWVVRKLKNLVSVRGGSTPSKEVELYWEGEIPWVSPKDMKSERISDSIDHVSELAIEDGGLNIVRSGAVLIVVRGMILIHSVPVAITDVDVTINQDMKAMAPGAELSSDYLSLMLQGVRDAVFQYIDSSAHGTRKLEWERFELMDLPIPPHEEQVRVVRFIEEQKHAIDDLAEQAASAIALMNERRSALISAAVTGKIDVRGWQPPVSTQAPKFEVAEAV